MTELGGEILGPDEGSKAIEPLSEQARQRFSAAAAAQKQLRRDEKRAKKKDDELARVLLELLNDPKFINIFRPVSALVARNCPSIFLLAIISLIHDRARDEVKNYFHEELQVETAEEVVAGASIPAAAAMNPDMRDELLSWITRLQMVIATDPRRTVRSFMVDAHHMDGNMLTVGVFLLQEFFSRHRKAGEIEKMKPLTTELLQLALEPFEVMVEEVEQPHRGDDENEEK